MVGGVTQRQRRNTTEYRFLLIKNPSATSETEPYNQSKSDYCQHIFNYRKCHCFFRILKLPFPYFLIATNMGIIALALLLRHHTLFLRASILLPLSGHNLIADDFIIGFFELSTGRIFTCAQVFVPSGICSV